MSRGEVTVCYKLILGVGADREECIEYRRSADDGCLPLITIIACALFLKKPSELAAWLFRKPKDGSALNGLLHENLDSRMVAFSLAVGNRYASLDLRG